MLDSTVQPNIPQPEETIRVALLVEYCGVAFRGSQYQPGQATVQSALQDALAALKLKASPVSFAGRTDTGVNARGQVAHFDIAESALVNIPHLSMALNAVLPETVSVRAHHLDTGRDFHSRRDAAFKWYRYTIHNTQTRSVWAVRNATAQHYPLLDAERMDQAARLLLGVHDFKSFKNPDTAITNDICDVRHIRVAREGEFIIFDIVADRFLYKMVRNMAGQLMRIGNAEHPLAPETMRTVLNARDRRRADQTAKADGLSLMAIRYPEPFHFFAPDLYIQQLESLLNHSNMESLPHENLFRKAS